MHGSDWRINPPTVSEEALPSFRGRAGEAIRAELGLEDGLPVKRPGGLYVVLPSQPAALRRAAEEIARYFRREFGYDFVQYTAGEEAHDKDRTYVWVRRPGVSPVVIGGCSFRWREYQDHPPGFELSWCWLHPYARNNGLLKDAWPFFRARFPGFRVEWPISPAMQGFLEKYDPEELRR